MWQTLVRHRAFRRLWIAATVDGLGSWLLVMAVPVRLYALTGSATSTSAALAVGALPALVAGPWAGVVTDRFSHRPVLVAGNLTAAAGVGAMLAGDRPAFLYAGLVVESVAACLLQPALRAATPTLVPDEAALASANALLALSGSTWRLAAPLLGTYLTATGRFPAVVLADLASYLLAGAIISTVRVPPSARTARTTTRAGDGLRLVARVRTLRGLLAGSCLYWTANAGLTALLVPFATERLHAPGGAVGPIITGLGAGYLCGSALSGRLLLRFPARATITVSYAAVGFCFLVLFSTGSLAVAVAAAALSGVPGATATVALTHHTQVATPDGARGRVTAAFQASDAVAAVAGALAAPAILAAAGLPATLLIFSTAVLACAPATALLLPPAGPPATGTVAGVTGGEPGGPRPGPRTDHRLDRSRGRREAATAGEPGP